MEQEKTGRLIAQKRGEKGLTQEQLAGKLGVTNKAVSKWETGKSMPDVGIMQELCKILGITVTMLLNGEEDQEEKLVFKLLWAVEKLKQLYTVAVGLILCYVPQWLESLDFISERMKTGDFFSGVLKGGFVGMKIVGVVVFAYGLICYAQKEEQQKKSQ